MTAVLNRIPAPSTHDVVALVAGDSWSLTATFSDASGAAIDLTTAAIAWAFLDSRFAEPLLPTDFTVGPGNASGQCTVTVPPASSTKVPAGSYTNYWRIVIGGVATTMLTGRVIVGADPFGAAVQPARVQSRSRPSIVRAA